MDTEQSRYIPLTMVRKDMEQIPVFDCPDGFRIRAFRHDDQQNWARIEALAGEFTDENQALQHFEEEFGSVLSQMKDRCFLLEDNQGVAIGTATAWFGSLAEQQHWGRVHWVGMVPAYQGRKLAKPLLSTVMRRLERDHSRAFLTTTTKSHRAINMYLDFGFIPMLVNNDDERHWRTMEQTLQRQILTAS